MLDHKTYVEAFKNTITFRGKIISDLTREVDSVLNEFNEAFPKGNIKQLTIEQYALGLPNSKDSYSYWLEYKTKVMLVQFLVVVPRSLVFITLRSMAKLKL